MGRPLRIEYPGAVYHVTSRGNERKSIFLSDEDRKAFFDILAEYHDRYGILIHGYILMDNHYHLIVETPEGNLLKVMHGINSRYTAYFNRAYRRSGHLFQGRYKAILVDKDIYLVELSRYIHLNPVRAGMAGKPEQYAWSSYRGYIGKGKAETWVEHAWILGQFGKDSKEAQRNYKKYVEKDMTGEEPSPFETLWGQVILGGDEFRKKIQGILKGKPLNREIIERKRLTSAATPKEIIRAVANGFAAEEDEITRPGKRGNIARMAALHLVQRYSGLKNEEIGKLFGGIHYSAVTKASGRLMERMKKERSLNRRVQEIISYVKT